METHKDLIDAIGVEYLAKKLTRKPNTVIQWRHRNRIPDELIIELIFLRKVQLLKIGLKEIRALSKGKPI